MGLKYEKIRKKPAQILSLTGLTGDEFDFLSWEFSEDWDNYISPYTLESKPRQRVSPPPQTGCVAHADRQVAVYSCVHEDFSIARTPCRHFWYSTAAGKQMDTGFVGHRPDGVQVIMPTKKPRGKELTQSQKNRNKEISKVRIVVEQAIGGAKRCRIVKDRMRCH